MIPTLVRRMCRPLIGLCFFSPVGALGGEAKPRTAVPPDFERTVTDIRADWSVPGIAVAVIQGDSTIFAQGFGARQWDRPEPVTQESLFGIASITKSHIAGALAKLVGEGKLGWDDTVISHLPDFKLADPYVTQSVTIRDFLTHRSGIAAHLDWLEQVDGLSEADALKRFAFLGQEGPFRARYKYSSLAFIPLTQIVEKVTGQAWGAYLREALWQPLGMHNTYAHSTDFVAEENIVWSGEGWSDGVKLGQDAVKGKLDVASPHVQWEAYYRGKYFMDPRELDNRLAHFHRTAMDPGQSVFSSVSDMALYMRALLNDGRVGNRQVVAADAVRAMRQLNIVRKGGDWPINWLATGRKGIEPIIHEIGYGLGLEIYEYQGHILFGHRGDELGYTSYMAIDPGSKLGVVVLANNRTWSSGLTYVLAQTILDWHYGFAATDWSKYYLERNRRGHEKTLADIARLEAAFPKDVKPSADIKAYAGTYHHPFMGNMIVEIVGNELRAKTGPTFWVELEHFSGDRFKATVNGPLRFSLLFAFEMNARGKPSAVVFEHPWLQEDIRFQKSDSAND